MLLAVRRILPRLYLLWRQSDSESLVAFFAVEHHLVMGVLMHVAGRDHLAHEFCRRLIVLGLLLCLLDPASEACQFSHVVLDLQLFGGVLFLFLLYLGFGASSLASDLE